MINSGCNCSRKFIYSDDRKPSTEHTRNRRTHETAATNNPAGSLPRFEGRLRNLNLAIIGSYRQTVKGLRSSHRVRPSPRYRGSTALNCFDLVVVGFVTDLLPRATHLSASGPLSPSTAEAHSANVLI